MLGNHDGETVAKSGSGLDSMAIWSNTTGKRYFPNHFYTGNRTPQPHTSSRRAESALLAKSHYPFVVSRFSL